jgi:hypothetical protein
VGPISTYRLDSDEWGSQSRTHSRVSRHGASKRLAPLRRLSLSYISFIREHAKLTGQSQTNNSALSSPYILLVPLGQRRRSCRLINTYTRPITVEATHREGIICASCQQVPNPGKFAGAVLCSKQVFARRWFQTDSLAIAGSRIHTGLAGVDVNESASSNCISTTTMFEEELKQRIHIYRLDVCFGPAQASTDRHSISAGPDARLQLFSTGSAHLHHRQEQSCAVLESRYSRFGPNPDQKWCGSCQKEGKLYLAGGNWPLVGNSLDGQSPVFDMDD